MKIDGFRSEKYLRRKISDNHNDFFTDTEDVKNLRPRRLSPQQLSKNPSSIVCDFVDTMQGMSVKYGRIALWNGCSKVQSLYVELLDQKKMLLRAKINLAYYVISDRSKKKIEKLKQLQDLPSIEITFSSEESLGIVLLSHAIAMGDQVSIQAAESGLGLQWTPSMEYGWTSRAGDLGLSSPMQQI